MMRMIKIKILQYHLHNDIAYHMVVSRIMLGDHLNSSFILQGGVQPFFMLVLV